MSKPDFWKDKEAASKIVSELSELKEQTKLFDEIEKKLSIIKKQEIAEESQDQIEKEIKKLEKNIKKLELETLFSAKGGSLPAGRRGVSGGKYDKNNAFLHIYSGAGGVDAQDWASMLLKMYQKYAESRGWSYKVLDQSFGEQKGIKSVVVEIRGRYAYGYLRNENGVHRLVRISPFSAKKLRHTSFVLVQVLPEIKEKEFVINPNDLRIDTFRSSGPGGQYLQKTETAVRITHIPTGVTVSVQSERSQNQNKEKAMKILISRLTQKLEKEKVKEISELKPELATGIEWGNQIRSYVLDPYKLVKDHRTGVEVNDVEKVLNGNLDKFIKESLI